MHTQRSGAPWSSLLRHHIMAGALRREAQPFRAPTSATRPRRAGGPDAADSTPRTRTQCLRRAAFVDGLRRDPAWAWSGLGMVRPRDRDVRDSVDGSATPFRRHSGTQSGYPGVGRVHGGRLGGEGGMTVNQPLPTVCAEHWQTDPRWIADATLTTECNNEVRSHGNRDQCCS